MGYTLITFLGCLSCISRAKNCLKVHIVGAFSLVALASLVFQKTYIWLIPGISNHSHATKELSRNS